MLRSCLIQKLGKFIKVQKSAFSIKSDLNSICSSSTSRISHL